MSAEDLYELEACVYEFSEEREKRIEKLHEEILNIERLEHIPRDVFIKALKEIEEANRILIKEHRMECLSFIAGITDYTERYRQLIDDEMLELPQYVKSVEDLEMACELAIRGDYKESAHYLGKAMPCFYGLEKQINAKE